MSSLFPHHPYFQALHSVYSPHSHRLYTLLYFCSSSHLLIFVLSQPNLVELFFLLISLLPTIHDQSFYFSSHTVLAMIYEFSLSAVRQIPSWLFSCLAKRFSEALLSLFSYPFPSPPIYPDFILLLFIYFAFLAGIISHSLFPSEALMMWVVGTTAYILFLCASFIASHCFSFYSLPFAPIFPFKLL